MQDDVEKTFFINQLRWQAALGRNHPWVIKAAADKAAAAAYTAERYHKPMDEYSDSWDLSGFQEDINTLFQVGHAIADSTDWPTWYEGNEFEAARKASLAGQ